MAVGTERQDDASPIGVVSVNVTKSDLHFNINEM
jgi:hypothetical protein